jgi:hypothetical protein
MHELIPASFGEIVVFQTRNEILVESLGSEEIRQMCQK